ncbi:ATPase SWSAP1 [Myripristis murdjan]|uniref:ATPase SWSAP1 n=1 Tax=Myripristis murdjan TaxID=586833 RepID=UPI001175F353|nr:ATPase SWSAP1-like [Myripristis murdjan]
MADILTHVFRTFIPEAGLTKDVKLISPSSTACSTLMVGERSVSRSVLLLAAVTAASEMDSKVFFFTQTQIQSLPVSLQSCIPNLSPETLKKIKFSYPRTVEDLLQQVASLHETVSTAPTPPSLVIVDRLEGYLHGSAGSSSHTGFHQGEQSCAAHVSALLCDTAAFLTQILEQRGSSSAPCRVIASYHSELQAGSASGELPAPDPILAVLDRYFQVRCTLDRDRSCKATAAGLQELWHIFLSGTGLTEASPAKGSEVRNVGVAHEWQLVIFPDGLMEFTLV